MIDWHRLFGLALTDFFTGSPYTVELEKDLSIKRQFLDVVILRAQGGKIQEKLPDGLENLAQHNLLSYKSLREPFDDWAIKELIGHFVNYRKQVSPSFKQLLPQQQFQIYGISTRYPQKLASQIKLQPLCQGVYDILWGTDTIRLIVLSEISKQKHNSIWHLFSGVPETIQSAAMEYKGHTSEVSSIINQLFENYQLEGLNMPYTMEDFRKDCIKEYAKTISLDEVLDQYNKDEVLTHYSPEERLKGLSLEEQLKGVSTEDLLKRLSTEEIKKYLKKINSQE